MIRKFNIRVISLQANVFITNWPLEEGEGEVQTSDFQGVVSSRLAYPWGFSLYMQIESSLKNSIY
jgi:hypothetical protein